MGWRVSRSGMERHVDPTDLFLTDLTEFSAGELFFEPLMGSDECGTRENHKMPNPQAGNKILRYWILDEMG
jgi:hypothetical protein